MRRYQTPEGAALTHPWRRHRPLSAHDHAEDLGLVETSGPPVPNQDQLLSRQYPRCMFYRHAADGAWVRVIRWGQASRGLDQIEVVLSPCDTVPLASLADVIVRMVSPEREEGDTLSPFLAKEVYEALVSATSPELADLAVHTNLWPFFDMKKFSAWDGRAIGLRELVADKHLEE